MQNLVEPDYECTSYTKKHHQPLWTAMNGGRLQDGSKSHWDINKQQVFGTNDNPNGQCRVQLCAGRITSKELGVCVGKKKRWTLPQAAFVYEFGNLPLNECQILIG